jgi:intraflagellar transport protein 140
MDTDMMRFALKAAPTLMLECAAYFEERSEYEKAIQLYHKGGDLGKAMDLCFKGAEALNVTVKGRSKPDTSKSQGVFEMMNEIAADLGVGTSPQTLARCAEFLMQHRQYERAIDLYILAKRFPQAIEMCMKNSITITDDMAEKLSPKVSPDIDEATSRDTLKLLAKTLKSQGSYALASRKYTQAGDRLRAIKCLVRSGDTRAVIQFATVTRNPEIYKLAANYLQVCCCTLSFYDVRF